MEITLKSRMENIDVAETFGMVRNMGVGSSVKHMNDLHSIVHDLVHYEMGNDECIYYMETHVDTLVKEVGINLLWELFDDLNGFDDLVNGRYVGDFDVYDTYLLFSDSCVEPEYIRCSTNNVCDVTYDEVHNELIGEHDIFEYDFDDMWSRLGEYFDETIVARFEAWATNVAEEVLANV